MPHGSTIHHGFVTRHGLTGAHGYVGLHGSTVTEDDVFGGEDWLDIDNPVDLSLTPFNVTRNGFDNAGNQTTYVETMFQTKRIRNVWPATGTFTARKVAANEQIYTGDTSNTVVLSPKAASPKPIGRWAMMDRRVVGNSIDWEICAAHRNARSGRQIVCARVRATDGVSFTPWQVVAIPVVSTYCEDVYPIEVYKGTLDVSSLSDGGVLIRLEGQLIPWIGGLSSINYSQDEPSLDQFSSRYFWRNTARAAAPPIAYVGAATGNDGTGVWATNDATASANPFATFTAAYAAIVTQSAATGGYADGCMIKVLTGGAVFGSGAGTLRCPHYLGAVTVTAATGVARVDAVVSWGSTNLRPNTGVATGNINTTVGPGETALIFENVNLTRTGASSMAGTSAGGVTPPLFVQYRNCLMNNASQTAAMLSSTAHDAAFGLVVSNVGATASSAFSGSQQRRCWRGLDIDMADIHTLRFSTLIGSRVDRFAGATQAEVTKGIFMQCFELQRQKSPLTINAPTGSVLRQCALLQGLFEHIGALTGGVAQPALTLASSTGDSDHIVIHHCVGTGFGEEGRWNLAYSGFAPPGLNQNHTNWSFKGNIPGQPNLKGDWFSANPLLVGNFRIHHGVGFNGNWAQFHPNVTANESEGWAYFGITGSYPTGPTSNEVRNDPLFVDYKGTTGTGSTAVAGTGGGNYRLQAGSPARNLFNEYLMAYDKDGNARPTSGNVPCGAYL